MINPKTQKIFFSLAVLTLAFLLCGGTSLAQRTMVTVEGTVVDEDGNFLPGATITARNPETGYTKSVVISGLNPAVITHKVTTDNAIKPKNTNI